MHKRNFPFFFSFFISGIFQLAFLKFSYCDAKSSCLGFPIRAAQLVNHVVTVLTLLLWQLHDSSHHSFYCVNIRNTECLYFYEGTMSPDAMLMVPPHWCTAAYNSTCGSTIQFCDGTKK